jgi:hypothetical protein
MPQYQTIPEYRISSRSRGSGVIHVHTADLIPAGMQSHAALSTHRRTADEVVAGMVAKGMDAAKARGLVQRAITRHRQGLKSRRTHRKAAGMGDAASDAADVLVRITALAQDAQEKHKAMIQRAADREAAEPGILSTDNDLRTTFIDNLTGLSNKFVDDSLPIVGIQFPYQLNRTNPAHAIIIAVRDDINDTANLLQAKSDQIALAKQIKEISKLPFAAPSAPGWPTVNLNFPWYVWGGAALAAAVAAKSAHLW